MTEAHTSVSSTNVLGQQTTLVDYHSAGSVLIIVSGQSELQRGLDAATQLNKLSPSVLILDSAAAIHPVKQLTDAGIAVITCRSVSLAGYLGAFVCHAVDTAGQSVQDIGILANAMGKTDSNDSVIFDLILDTTSQSCLTQRTKPFGYFHAANPHGLKAALAELPEMVGEFEKPRYFRYDETRCAHSRSQLPGCNQCVKICSTEAISTAGDGIQVNPWLCQGCGTCTVVCPSGAISYAWPTLSRATSLTRTLRKEAKAAEPTTLVIYRQTDDPESDVAFEKTLPASAMAVAVEEVTAFGLDFWLTQFCNGFSHIVIAMPDRTDEDNNPDVQAVRGQAEILESMLRPLGFSASLFTFCLQQQAATLSQSLSTEGAVPVVAPASFEVFNDKRLTVRQAMDYLCHSVQLTPEPVQLSRQLPGQGHVAFGRINVDQQQCTLCMGCVSTCPAGALLDGQGEPRLRFIEANCVQCGLCEKACPESVITLEPRYQFDSEQARKPAVLVEEQPFDCVRCGKPFATQRMIDMMARKLQGHWMFQNEAEQRRLKMCEDCRVVDLLEKERDKSEASSTHV